MKKLKINICKAIYLFCISLDLINSFVHVTRGNMVVSILYFLAAMIWTVLFYTLCVLTECEIDNNTSAKNEKIAESL